METCSLKHINKNDLKQGWLHMLALWNQIQMHKRLKRMLILMGNTKRAWIFKVDPFLKARDWQVVNWKWMLPTDPLLVVGTGVPGTCRHPSSNNQNKTSRPFSFLNIIYLSVPCFEKEVCLKVKHLSKVWVGPVKSTFSLNLLCV